MQLIIIYLDNNKVFAFSKICSNYLIILLYCLPSSICLFYYLYNNNRSMHNPTKLLLIPVCVSVHKRCCILFTNPVFVNPD